MKLGACATDARGLDPHSVTSTLETVVNKKPSPRDTVLVNVKDLFVHTVLTKRRRNRRAEPTLANLSVAK